MLQALTIRDIVLIDKLTLEPGSGLVAVTGETGAGKSIVIDALALALGARGDGSLVRAGCEKGQVSAIFHVPPDHPVLARLEESDVEAGSELILRRVQSADGRTRAFINDQPVSVQLLREIGSRLVEIHGQHDDRALVEPRAHLRLLDAAGGLEEEAAAVAAAWQAKVEAGEALALHRELLEKSRQEEDYLRFAVEELEALAAEPGEEEELASTRQLMMNAEKFTGDLNEAFDALTGDGATEARLAAAARKLERAAETAGGRLDQAVGAIDRALAELTEAREAVAEALRAVEYDPGRLEKAEERLFALRAASRKYSVPVEGLAAHGERLKASLEAIDSGADRLAELEQAADAADAAFMAAAGDLSARRREAAKALDQAVMAELPPLKLEKARFVTELTDLGPEGAGASGLERAEFTLAANPGSQPGPLMKVASGGELARVILALKVVLAARGSAPTLIFDEIDSGVSGATAEAIGVRLAKLAETVQVFAVTHSPQVAARAGDHLRIAKADGDERAPVLTSVDVLDEAERKEEIARMLAGATVTDEARAAAGRLMEGHG